VVVQSNRGDVELLYENFYHISEVLDIPSPGLVEDDSPNYLIPTPWRQKVG
jgi:hypothetical protein